MELHLQSEFFQPENLVGSETKELFGGKFTLTIETYKTQEGAWNYTWGKVRNAEGNLVASIQRNYGSFSCSELSGDQIMVGHDYQQTSIINLKDQTYRELGTGFCVIGASISPSGKTLLAWGCFWACPYEYQFFDLAGSGTEAKMMKIDFQGETWLDLYEDKELDPPSVHSPEVASVKWEGDDRLVWTKKMLYYTDLQKRGDEADAWAEKLYPFTKHSMEYIHRRSKRLGQEKREYQVDEIAVFERQGDKMVQVDGFVSEGLQAYRDEQNAYESYHKTLVNVWTEGLSLYRPLKDDYPQSSDMRGYGAKTWLIVSLETGLEVSFEVKFTNLNWSNKEVLERFCGEVSDETKALIRDCADYTGNLAIKKRGQCTEEKLYPNLNDMTYDQLKGHLS